jgi:hypothetical protein
MSRRADDLVLVGGFVVLAGEDAKAEDDGRRRREPPEWPGKGGREGG